MYHLTDTSHTSDGYAVTDDGGMLAPLYPFYSRSALCALVQRDAVTGEHRAELYTIAPQSRLAQAGFTISARYHGAGYVAPKDPSRHITVIVEPGPTADTVTAVYAGAAVRQALTGPDYSERYLRIAVVRRVAGTCVPTYVTAAPPDEAAGPVTPNDGTLVVRPYRWRDNAAARTLRVVLRLRFVQAPVRVCVPVLEYSGTAGWGGHVCAAYHPSRLDATIMLSNGEAETPLRTTQDPAAVSVVDALADLYYGHPELADPAPWHLAGVAPQPSRVRVAPTLVVGDVTPASTRMLMTGLDAARLRDNQVDYASIFVLPELQRPDGRLERLPPTHTPLALHYDAAGALASASCPALLPNGDLEGTLFRLGGLAAPPYPPARAAAVDERPAKTAAGRQPAPPDPMRAGAMMIAQ